MSQLSGIIRGIIHQARLNGGKWNVNISIQTLQEWAKWAEMLERERASEHLKNANMAAGGDMDDYV